MAAPGILHCRNCGSTIPPPFVACPNCRSAPYVGTNFCYGCGAATAANLLACTACGAQMTGAIAPAVLAGPVVPGKVTAINIMTLVGGILGILISLTIMIATLFLYVPWIYGLVMGIMTTIKGAKLVGANRRNEEAPKTTAIMQIINIINCDWINCAAGIVIVVFLSDPQVRAWYRQPYAPQPPIQPQPPVVPQQ